MHPLNTLMIKEYCDVHVYIAVLLLGSRVSNGEFHICSFKNNMHVCEYARVH